MRSTALALTAPLLVTSCALERLFADDVAHGVARLTARNAGALVGLLNDDARCGFASDEVLANPRIDGVIGGVGSVTWSVRDCQIDLGGGAKVADADCHGDGATTGSGAVVATATRTISGRLTGDDENPVIPAGPDSVVISVEARFTDFAIEAEGDGNVLTQRSGTLSFVVEPRLAVAAETPGICAAPTPNARIRGIRYDDAVVHVKTPERAFEVPVSTSMLTAVNGVHGDDENRIEGDIALWTDPPRGVAGDLDPAYDAERFSTSFVGPHCPAREPTPGAKTLAEPLSFTCEGVGGELAPGVARLSLATLGTIASLVESDTECGFASMVDVAHATLDVDENGRGTATWSVTGCELRFPEKMIVDTDCTGAHTMVSGKITVTATKTLAGRATGHPTNPILPLDDRPARIVLERVDFDRFVVENTARAESLVFDRGTASLALTPRTAKSASLGACAVVTPNARLDDVVLTDVTATLSAPVGRFTVEVERANLRAVNGMFDDEENAFEGEIVVDGETYALPVDGDEGLVPGYDAALFTQGYASCAADLAAPIDFASCDLEPVLISGAARLTVSTFGAIAGLVESDAACGFSSQAALDSVVVEGELGRAGGKAVYAVSDCVIDLVEPFRTDEDCAGKASTLTGRVVVSGTKTLRGIVSGDPSEPIVPTSWAPATVELSLSFSDLRVETDGRSEVFVVEYGALTGRVDPRTGIDTAVGACSIALPIATLSELAWSDASVRIETGETFVRLPISSSLLDAQSGQGELAENHLAGTLTVGAETFAVPFDGDDHVLDPDYERDDFVASFSCRENLALPDSDAACSFNKVLGEGAARLIVQAMGEAASMVNADGDCGFENLGILMDSVKAPENADPGDMGTLTFVTEGCAMNAASEEPGAPVSTDCVGKDKHRSGTLTVTSTRVVAGELEEIAIFGISIADSIIPRTRDAVTVSLDAVTFADFVMWSVRPDGSGDLGVLAIESGTGSALVRPVLGENEDEPGVFMTPTPVSALDDVVVSDVTATLLADGKTFKLDIASTDLRAFNGSFGGRSNEIAGTIVVNGELVTLDDGALDPAFDQASFDASYACTENLAAVIPAP